MSFLFHQQRKLFLLSMFLLLSVLDKAPFAYTHWIRQALPYCLGSVKAGILGKI